MLRSRVLCSRFSTLQHRRSINVQWTRTRTSRSDANMMQSQTREEDMLMKSVYKTDSALIRTHPFPKSMRDVYAIIRAVEKNYGLIKEFKCFRDDEVSTNHQSIIRVAFRNPESQKRIHEDAEELQVVLPPAVPSDQPGGIGLADLEEYLETTESPITSRIDLNNTTVPMLHNVLEDVIEESEEKAESKTAERVITCRIQRVGTSFYTPSRLALYWPQRKEREATARQFLNWGGFHDFPPLPANHPLPDEDFFKESQLEHFRMRRCLRRASERLEMPNPHELSPNTVPDSMASMDAATKAEWEPLSGPETAEVEHDPLNAALEDAKWESGDGRASTALDILASDLTKTVLASQAAEASLDFQDANTSTASPPKTPFVPAASTSLTDNAKELEVQLRAARSLARQVAREQKARAAPASTVPLSEVAQGTWKNKDSLLEPENPPTVINSTPQKTTPLETLEQVVDDSRQKQGSSVVGRLWSEIF